MPLIQFVLILIAVGVLLYLVNAYIQMDATIKRILNIAVVIGVVLWVLGLFGLFGALSAIRIGS